MKGQTIDHPTFLLLNNFWFSFINFVLLIDLNRQLK